MSKVIMKHFDKLAFVDEAKSAGADEKFARVIADQFEQLSERHSGELDKELNQVATKSDLISTKMELKSDIKELEIRLIKWQIAICATTITSVVALLKLFH